ncbi:MAG: lipid II flippase MurJ, partial [Kiritimatiellia bacterium]
MKLLRNAATVGGLTAVSRILGLVREIFMANLFGTSLVKSAFDLAFRIPNLFRAIFGEGALSQAFIPIYTQTRTREGAAGANIFAGKVLTLLATILCTITAITIIGIRLAQPWLTYGSRPETVLRLLGI